MLFACALVLAAGDRSTLAQFAAETRDVSRGGTTAAMFLAIPVGARATSMGSAFAASADDATAMYWNPAGLGHVQSATVTAEYAAWLAGIAFNYVAAALPTRLGTVGISVTGLQTPDMLVTTVQDQNGTGETFDAASYAVGLTFGRAATERFAFGISVKAISERIWHSTATGYAVDAGTVFETPFRGIRLGAALTNFGTKMRIGGEDLLVVADLDPTTRGNNQSNSAAFRTDAFDLPLTMRIGLAGEAFESSVTRLTLAVDVLSPNSSDQYVNVGAEIGLLGDLLQIRGGLSELFLSESVRSFAVGAGLRHDFGPAGFAADYAFEAQQYFGGVNRITLAVNF